MKRDVTTLDGVGWCITHNYPRWEDAPVCPGWSMYDPPVECETVPVYVGEPPMEAAPYFSRAVNFDLSETPAVPTVELRTSRWWSWPVALALAVGVAFGLLVAVLLIPDQPDKVWVPIPADEYEAPDAGMNAAPSSTQGRVWK